MNPTEVNRFKELYQRHLRLLKLQGKSQKTIDAYLQVNALVRLEKSTLPEDSLPASSSKKDISLYIQTSQTKPGLYNNRIRLWFVSFTQSIFIRYAIICLKSIWLS